MVFAPPDLLILTVLGLIVYFDFRLYRILDILVLLFLILSLCRLKENFYGLTALGWGIGFITLKILMEKILKRPALGGGDIKLVFVMGLWFPSEVTPLFLIITGGSGVLLSLIYKIIWQKNIFPFAPALVLGFLWSVNFFI